MSTRSFMKSIFSGIIEGDLIFPYPRMPAEERETVKMFLENIDKFAEKNVDSKAIDRNHLIPPDVLNGMKALGLFGLNIPEAYGGIGLSHSAYSRVMSRVAAIDASLAVTLGAHQSIGLKGILLFGTEAQKKKYLPKLATGEHVAAFALTEPSAGSDAASITTRAEFDQATNTFVLNGSKIWITNGGMAEIFTVFARTRSPKDGDKPKITAFIVERGFGVKNGPSEEKLGIRGSSTTELFFEDVKVPADNVLGEVGKGFKVAMEILNSGRLGLAAGCLGASRTLIAMATERCQERKAFQKSIGEFGMIKDKIARMMAETYALESMTFLTTGLLDKGVADYSIESAICKVFGSETLWYVVNETLQVAAGIGYMTEYPYERMLRDARINLIFEGTNEILRAFIALCGMQGPGEQLSEVAKAMREPIKGFGLLSEFAVQKAKAALGRERLSQVHPLMQREAVLFEDTTQALNREVERALRRHGRDIAFKQFIQKRIAEVAIDLYALAAVLSRTSHEIQTHGESGAAEQIKLAEGFYHIVQRRLQHKLSLMERDEDELFKDIADKAYARNGYAFDIAL